MPQFSLLPIVNGKVRLDMKCVACELSQNPDLRTNCMSGSGAENPTYLFVGHAPGAEDDRIGEPMTGRNGQLLQRLLRHAGIGITDCYFTNTLRCCPYGKNLKETHFKHCRDYLIKDIKQLNPTVIVSAGAQSMTWLTGSKGVSKLRRRGLPCCLPIGRDILVFPIRQPAGLFHVEGSEYDQLFDEMVSDLVWIKEQVECGIVHRAGDIETDYQTARTEDDIERFFAELEEKDCLACDLETGDINFEPRLFPGKDCKIISIGFSSGIGHARAIPLYARGLTSVLYWPDGFMEKVIYPRLTKLLKEKEIFGHNFVSFDQKWVRKELGIPYCNIKYDTMLGHYLLNEERGTHDLEFLAILYTTMSPWKASFTLSDTDKMCQYLCRDVDATFRLRTILEPQLNDLQRWLLDNILIPAGNVLMDVEYNGVNVSTENLHNLNHYLESEIKKETERLQKSKAVQEFQILNVKTFNPASPNHVRDVLQKHKGLRLQKKTDGGKYSVDVEVLEGLSDVPEAQAILRYRKLEKLKSTYCIGLIKSADENNKVHTTYKIHSTVTGRLASENPNLQNIPRKDTVGKVLEDGSIIKSVFASQPGYCLLQADYSQIELRVLACLANDERMIDIYKKGQDLHSQAAAAVFNIPVEQVTPEQRTGAKSVNFGIVYGMSLDKLIAKFSAAGNTEEAAKRFLYLHKNMFPGVWQYMEDQEQLIRVQRFQETPFGRRRRYQDITSAEIRQALNFPIQSTASDFTLLSISRCPQVLKELQLDARLVLTVHDSLIFEVRLDQFWQVAQAVKSVMEGWRFDWLTVPIVADMEAGKNWGKLKKVKFSDFSFST